MNKTTFTQKAEYSRRIIRGYARGFKSFRAKNLSSLRMEMSPDYASPLAVILSVFCLSEMFLLAFIPNAGTVISAFLFLISSVFIFTVSLLIKQAKLKYALRFSSFIVLALSLGIFTATFFGFKVRVPNEKILAEYPGKEEVPVILQIGRVVSKGETYGTYDCTVISIDGTNARNKYGIYPKIRLSSFGNEPQPEGNVISLNVTISRPEEISGNGFRERQYLESQSIFIYAEAKSTMKFLANRRKTPVETLRNKLSDGLLKYTDRFSEDVSGIARCMLLGEKSALTDYVKEIFRASGVSHILCVSGMHLSILFFVMSHALHLGKRKRRRFPVGETVSLFIALLYMAIADFTPSIMRAGFMLIFANIFSALIYYIKKFGLDTRKFTSVFSLASRKRPPKTPIMGTLTCLLLSAAFISIISPNSLFDIGMQLSFMSTLGIILSLPVIKWITKFFGSSTVSYILGSFAMTLFAVGFTFPVSVYHFGTVSVFSPVVNLFLMPLSTLLLILLLILALISLMPQVLPVARVCSGLGYLCGFLCETSINICDYFSKFSYSVLDAENSIFVNIVFALFVASSFVFAAFSKKKLSSLSGLFAVSLYLLCLVFYFSGTYKARCIPDLTLCTVSQRPYVCVSKNETRIIFDPGASLAETKHALSVKGETLYPTETIYVVVTSSDLSSENVLFNIDAFSTEIKTVLLPTPEKASISGTDVEEYTSLVTQLLNKEINIAFYSSSFSVSALHFDMSTKMDKTGFVFDNKTLVFASDYDEKFASDLSENSDYCIYFCDRAKNTENTGYTSKAKLYVSSAQQKKIKGSLKIPTGKATLFTGN